MFTSPKVIWERDFSLLSKKVSSETGMMKESMSEI